MAGFFEKISEGLGRTRDKFQEQVNVLLDKGPNLDDDFWEGLEEALISADIGAPAVLEIIDNLQEEAKRKALPDAKAVLDLLSDRIAEQFARDKKNILAGDKAVILFVGINGTGKTTTVGKIAKEATDLGVKVILGSADTFRAAAIEQLEVWANRANVEMVTRERGSDPASVCYATIERAEEIDSDLVLIDTAGRLHTSKDLMVELQKVCNVTRKRSKIPVYVVLVIDATTGQNGLTQAKQFNEFLDLDALIVTKLDGTAKGGIALAISKELDLPILKIGVGEKIEDLRNFDAHQFSKAFLGEFGNDTQTNEEVINQDDTLSDKQDSEEISSFVKDETNDFIEEEHKESIFDEQVNREDDTVLDSQNYLDEDNKESENDYNNEVKDQSDVMFDDSADQESEFEQKNEVEENIGEQSQTNVEIDDNIEQSKKEEQEEAEKDYNSEQIQSDDELHEDKVISDDESVDSNKNRKEGKIKGLFKKLFMD